ncbi:MAG: hypothetical protein K2I68_04505, partial [Bacteroidales bacterium]|nr:hypothetical protein [Bacteroidales bacterium]
LENFDGRLRYVEACPPRFRRRVEAEKQEGLQMINYIRDYANAYHAPALANSAERLLSMR